MNTLVFILISNSSNEVTKSQDMYRTTILQITKFINLQTLFLLELNKMYINLVM